MTLQRWRICIFRTEKPFWRTRYLKLRYWEKSLNLAQKAKRRNVACRSFSPITHLTCLHFAIGPRNGPILDFGDEGDGEDDEDGTVDLLGQSVKEPEEESDDEDEGEEGEPEDDFNAAWEVFELARGIYEKGSDGNDEVKLKLADTYIALGDVSLETGAATLLRHREIINACPQRSLIRQ